MTWKNRRAVCRPLQPIVSQIYCYFKLLAAVASEHPVLAIPLIGHGLPKCQPFPSRGSKKILAQKSYPPADSLPPLWKGEKIYPGTELGAHSNHLLSF